MRSRQGRTAIGTFCTANSTRTLGVGELVPLCGGARNWSAPHGCCEPYWPTGSIVCIALLLVTVTWDLDRTFLFFCFFPLVDPIAFFPIDVRGRGLLSSIVWFWFPGADTKVASMCGPPTHVSCLPGRAGLAIPGRNPPVCFLFLPCKFPNQTPHGSGVFLHRLWQLVTHIFVNHNLSHTSWPLPFLAQFFSSTANHEARCAWVPIQSWVSARKGAKPCFRPVLGSLPGSNSEGDRRSDNPFLSPSTSLLLYLSIYLSVVFFIYYYISFPFFAYF